MSSENETFLKHLKAQLEDLKVIKVKFDDFQDSINEIEQNCALLKQESNENENHLEESIKTHVKILESIKAENVFMSKNLVDKQILNENSFQILNNKKNEMKILKNEVSIIESKIEIVSKLTEETNDKIAGARLKSNQLNADKTNKNNQVIELKENIRITNEEINNLKINEIEKENNFLLSEKKKHNFGEILEDKKKALKDMMGKKETLQMELSKFQENLELKTKKIKETKNASNQLKNDYQLYAENYENQKKENQELEGLLKRKNKFCQI